MSNKILILSAIVLAVVFSSCKKMFEDEELSMERVDYTGTELRTDGYYYFRNRYVYDGKQFDQIEHRFLFRNGVSTDGGVCDYSVMGMVEDNIRNGTYYDKLKGNKSRWMVFRISDYTIEFEGWTWGDGGDYKLSTFREYGEIINDTTFRLIKEDYKGKVIEYLPDVIYHFKQFSPKPDSTNSFIK